MTRARGRDGGREGDICRWRLNLVLDSGPLCLWQKWQAHSGMHFDSSPARIV